MEGACAATHGDAGTPPPPSPTAHGLALRPTAPVHATEDRPPERCGYAHTRRLLPQHLLPPPRSAYSARRRLRGHGAGAPLCPPTHPLANPYHRLLVNEPQPPPPARRCASPPANKPASSPARVLNHTPAQPLQPPPIRPRTCCTRSAARTSSSSAPRVARCSTACSARCAGAASLCSRAQTAVGSLTRVYAQGVQLALREVPFYFNSAAFTRTSTTQACAPPRTPSSPRALKPCGSRTRAASAPRVCTPWPSARPATQAATHPPAHLHACSCSRLRNRQPASHLPACPSPACLLG